MDFYLGENGIELANNIAIDRHKKGNSIISFPKSYTLIDIETTGLDPRYDEIIEISALKVSNEKIIDEFSSFIKPESSISPYITELTGITNEMVENAPEIKKTLKKFLEFTGEDVVVGYNVHFDVNFLYDNILTELDLFFSNTIVDVMRLAKRIVKETKNHKLKTIAEYYGINHDNLHRGKTDCLTCFECFNKVKFEILAQYKSLEEFIKEVNYRRKIKVKDINTNKDEFDIDHPFYNKECVFTGKLSRMVRKDAMQIVVDCGGTNRDTVTKKTNYLILGDVDYSRVKDGKSSKHKKAEKYKIDGQDIEVISETVFYDLLV